MASKRLVSITNFYYYKMANHILKARVVISHDWNENGK